MNKTTKLVLRIIAGTVIGSIFGIIFVIFQISKGVNTETKNSADISYKDYVNQNFNIKLSYPSDYKTKEGYMGAVVFFLSPIENPNDSFQENLSVMVQDLSGQSLTLNDFSQLNLKQIETIVTNAKIISSKETTLAGKPGYEVIYSGQQGKYNLKWRQLWTIVDNKAYIISSTSEEARFDNYFETFNKMADSFEISN